MVQELSLHHPHGRPTLNSGVLALSWSSPECCGQLDNKTARGRSLCLSLCLSSQSDKRTASAEVPLIYSSIQGSSWEILEAEKWGTVSICWLILQITCGWVAAAGARVGTAMQVSSMRKGTQLFEPSLLSQAPTLARSHTEDLRGTQALWVS